jgi:hypothetical protein
MNTVFCYDDCNAGYNLVFRTADQAVSEMQRQYGNLPEGVTARITRTDNRVECYLSNKDGEELVAFAFRSEVIEPE